MKYSAVALLTLAQGIVAVPSLLGQIKQSQSKVLTTDQDISLVTPLQLIPRSLLLPPAVPVGQHKIVVFLC
jgi:hypothetical protein